VTHGLDVKKRLLKVERVVGETTVRRTIEADVELPFKVIKVFDIIADINDVETEVSNGTVEISGTIGKEIFVVDKGDLVRTVEEEVPFRVMVDVEGAERDMNVHVDIKVISVEAKFIESQTVRQTIVLEIFVKVTETKQIEVVVDVSDHDIDVDKELLKVDSVVGEDTVRRTISPTVTLPITARKVFRIKPSVRNVTAEIRTDTVILRGIIHKQIFFVDEGELVRHASEDVPFSLTVDIPGADSGMDVQFRVKVFLDDFELIDPPSKELRQMLIIEAFVKVTETVQIEVVTDVHGRNISVVKKLLKVDSVVVDVLQKETVRAVVKLPVQAIKIFDILGEIVELKAESRFDEILVKGVLHKQIFFVDPGDLVRHTREDVPFRFIKKAKGARPGMDVQVRARIIGDIRHRIIDDRGKKLEQTAIIEIFAKVTRTVQLEVVVDVKRERTIITPPPKPHKPGRDRDHDHDRDHDKKHDHDRDHKRDHDRW